VHYPAGVVTVIGGTPLPLSGPSFTRIMRGVGELQASLQMADPSVQALYPWDKVIPGKTGIVAVRHWFDGETEVTKAMWHGVVYDAPTSPVTGRMMIRAETVEGTWARRLITKAMTWAAADQTTIAADLLDPAKFSLIPLSGGNGWIQVDPPTVNTGVARDMSYAERQETNLLGAHQDRSQLLNNSYEWTTTVEPIGGPAGSVDTYKLVYQMGFPKLGRRLGAPTPPPNFLYDTAGFAGSVISFDYVNTRSGVNNIVWGRGKGYDDLQTKSLVSYVDRYGKYDWEYGFLQQEGRFSNPDVEDQGNLDGQTNRAMLQTFSSSRYLKGVSTWGQLSPYLPDYDLGDDIVFSTNDLTWPPELRDTGGFVNLGTRLFSYKVSPPQGDKAEIVELTLGGDLL
jgi:hypothetical protein